MNIILAFDLGTSGVKAVLFSQEGIILDKAFCAYQTYYPKAGWAEQNPNEWYQAICITTKQLFQEKHFNKKIAAISFSGQTMGCVCIDSKGRALRNALIHCDQRAVEQATRLKSAISTQRLYKLTGTRLSPSYPIEKLMWVKDNEPALYAQTYKMIGPKDYLITRLCGCIATEYTEASMSGCYLLKEMDWAHEILTAAEISIDKLPQILNPNDIAGTLSHECSQDMGIPEGIPIVMGGADGQCGCLGIAGDDTEHAYGYLGSAAVAYVSSPKLFLTGNPNLISINCNVVKGIYRYYSTMQTAGISYSWIQSLLSSNGPQKLSYEALDDYGKAGRGAVEGLFFLPYLLGERSPYWNAHAKGAFIGITPSHSAKDFIRAVMDGVAMNFAINYKELMKNDQKNGIILYGGCAKSPVWRQIFSDVLNTDVYISDLSEEAAAYGAMQIASAAINKNNSYRCRKNYHLAANPSFSRSKRYAEALTLFQEIYASLRVPFDQIADFMQQ